MDSPTNTANDEVGLHRKLLFGSYYKCNDDIKTVLATMREYLDSAAGQLVSPAIKYTFARFGHWSVASTYRSLTPYSLTEDFERIQQNRPKLIEAVTFLVKKDRLQELKTLQTSVKTLSKDLGVKTLLSCLCLLAASSSLLRFVLVIRLVHQGGHRKTLCRRG